MFLIYAFAVTAAGMAATFVVFVVFHLLPSAKGAPFAVTDDETIRKMLALAGVHRGEKAADLGSGDGRIVIALARAGAEAHGYEINPLLVIRARRRIREAGLQNKAFVHWKSFWRVDFSSFRVVTLYGITYIMKGLEEKLKKELTSGARVVSNYFQFPSWTEAAHDGKARLYMCQ